jgi:hypothetical protein
MMFFFSSSLVTILTRSLITFFEAPALNAIGLISKELAERGGFEPPVEVLAPTTV